MRQNETSNKTTYLPVTYEVRQSGLCLTSIGTETYPLGFEEYPKGLHEAKYNFDQDGKRTLHVFAFIFISKGSGVFIDHSEKHSEIQEGDVIFIAPGQRHHYSPHKDTGWTEHWVCLTGSYLYDLAHNLTIPKNSQIIKPNNTKQLHEKFNQLLRDVLHIPKTNKLSFGAQGLAFAFQCLNKDRVYQLSTRTDIDLPISERILLRTLQLISEQYYDTSFNVKSICDSLNVNRRLLERVFKQEHDKSISEEITLQRLQGAIEQLKTTKYSHLEIAHMNGFKHSTRMAEAFKRHLGNSPKNFRV